jgi:hypothetical protein
MATDTQPGVVRAMNAEAGVGTTRALAYDDARVMLGRTFKRHSFDFLHVEN